MQVHATAHVDLKQQFKDRLSAVKKLLKQRCKCNISTQNAYDVIAVAQGFKDYQTAKGLEGKVEYSIRVNLGDKTEPFWISKPLPSCLTELDACIKAKLALRDCTETLTWILFSGDTPTTHTFQSEPKAAGKHLSINVNAMSLAEAKDMLSNAVDGLSEKSLGRTLKGEMESCVVKICGDSQNYLFPEPHIVTSRRYAIVSRNGLYDDAAFEDIWTTDYVALCQSSPETVWKTAENIDRETLMQLIKENANVTLTVVPYRTAAIRPFRGTPSDSLAYMKKHPRYRFQLYQDTHVDHSASPA